MRIVRRGTGSVVTGGRHEDPGREPGPRCRATHHRDEGVRHLLAAYDLGRDRLYGHIEAHKTRTRFLEFCRYRRTLHLPQIRLGIVGENHSPHPGTRTSGRGGDRAEANNVDFACTLADVSWMNRFGARFTALRHFAPRRRRRRRPRHPRRTGRRDRPLHRRGATATPMMNGLRTIVNKANHG